MDPAKLVSHRISIVEVPRGTRCPKIAHHPAPGIIRRLETWLTHEEPHGDGVYKAALSEAVALVDKLNSGYGRVLDAVLTTHLGTLDTLCHWLKEGEDYPPMIFGFNAGGGPMRSGGLPFELL